MCFFDDPDLNMIARDHCSHCVVVNNTGMTYTQRLNHTAVDCQITDKLMPSQFSRRINFSKSSTIAVSGI